MESASMLVAIDNETALIAPGVIAPPLVCVSYAFRGRKGAITSGLLDAAKGLDFVRGVLRRGWRIVGQNVAYDLLVFVAEDPSLWPLVRAALDEGRVHDTMLAEQLLDIARGCFRFAETVDEDTGEVTRTPRDYSLESIAKRRLNRALDKGEDGWRLRYLELLGQPVRHWPERAREYARMDAVTALEVREAQEQDAGGAVVTNEAEQCRAAFALHVTGGRGLCVDMGAVVALEQELAAKRAQQRAALESAGVFRADGTKDMAKLRALVTAAYQGAAPMTPKGEVSTAATVLKDSGNEVLVAFADAAKTEKLLTAFVPALRLGANAPLTCRYNVLVESGRTSCSGVRVGKRKGPNVQQLPREGAVREVFVARPGYLLCSVDYAALELRTLAQVCLDEIGYSNLAEAFRAGRDPHLELAAEILGLSSDDAAAEYKAERKGRVGKARQQAKPANFGFPGGLGVRKFVAYAWASYGVRFTESEAFALRERWRARWPEVVELQRRIAAGLDPVTERATILQPRSNRVRGGCGYTEGCNTLFQGLAADGAKAALWRVVRDGREHGVKPVAFVHDEIVAEVREDVAHEAALWLRDTMVSAMAEWCPDVPIEAEPALARRWYKAMEPRYEGGRLVAWEPAAKAGAA